MNKHMKELAKKLKARPFRTLWRGLCLMQFWLWNLLLLLLMFVGLAPHVLPSCTMAVFSGEMPVSIYLGILGVMMIPLFSVIMGGVRFRDRGWVIEYFFTLELPFLCLFTLRSFVLKENTLAASVFLVLAFFAILYQAWRLFRPEVDQQKAGWPGNVLTLWLGATFGAVLVTMSLVWGTMAVLQLTSWAGDAGFWEGLAYAGFWGVMALALYVVTVGVLMVWPFIYSYVTIAHWSKWCRVQSALRYSVTGVGALILSLGLYFWADSYPVLDRLAVQKTISSHQALPDQEMDALKDEFIHIYLNKYRYPMREKSLRFFAREYGDALATEEFWLAQASRATVGYCLSPFIYQGGSNDGQRVEEFYSQIYDTPIQQDHRDEIVAAMEATYERNTAEAGILDVTSERVAVVEQSLTVEDHGSWAEVELFEAYQNQTFDTQELYYYFTLPDTAAITGLYLGNSPNKEEAFRHRVSPRGAAQKVYKEQRRRNVDPALLEQVGPHQFRLRVFPIPAKPRAWQRISRTTTSSDADQLYLWLEMQVVKEGDRIELPSLIEKRNTVFESEKACALSTETWQENEWLPDYIVGGENTDQLEFVEIEGQSFSLFPQGGETRSGSVALILDTSYSMREHDDEVKQILQELDLSQCYMFSPVENRLQELPAEWGYFGTLELVDLVNAYQNVPEVDHVIILTDSGGYEVSSDAPVTHEWPETTLNVLHVDQLAPAYTDAVLDTIVKSKGRVATDWRLLAPYVSEQTGTGQVGVAPAVAARHFINSQVASVEASALDLLHEMAMKYQIVTPFSSMIVLVNEQQHKMLDKAEQEEDRFERETDTGVTGINANAPSVPEPSVPLLVGLGGLYLLTARNRREQ